MHYEQWNGEVGRRRAKKNEGVRKGVEEIEKSRGKVIQTFDARTKSFEAATPKSLLRYLTVAEGSTPVWNTNYTGD